MPFEELKALLTAATPGEHDALELRHHAKSRIVQRSVRLYTREFAIAVVKEAEDVATHNDF